MKIIDLLNKIANGEEVPYFKYRDITYYYNFDYKEFISTQKYYRTGDITEHYFLLEEIDMTNLNDEVEILEEEKKIPEKLDTWYGIEPVNLDSPTTFKDNSKYIDFNTEMFFDKINEIIDYLKSKGE